MWYYISLVQEQQTTCEGCGENPRIHLKKPPMFFYCWFAPTNIYVIFEDGGVLKKGDALGDHHIIGHNFFYWYWKHISSPKLWISMAKGCPQ